jgi:hypothetical protein
VKCCFCGKEGESIEQAIDLGWYPDFWQGDENYQGPVCAECQQEHLFADESGEYLLKPGHSLPPAATPWVSGGPEVREVKTRLVMPPKFQLGHIVATPVALRAIEESGQTPEFFIDQHVQGHWGQVDASDWRANNQALVDGSRLLSAYTTLKGVKIWIITEAVGDDGRRAASTLIRPEEY